MTFDEDRQRTLEEWAERLGNDITSRVASAVAEVSASFAVTKTTTPVVPADARSLQRLLTAVRTFDETASLTDTLDALVTAASLEASRAAIFIVEAAGLRSWRVAGFGSLGSHAIEIPIASGDIVGKAAETDRVTATTGASTSSAGPPDFAALPPDRHALAVPLSMAGQVFAVLYADEGAEGNRDREWWPCAVEILTRFASRSVESLTSRRLAQLAVPLEQRRGPE